MNPLTNMKNVTKLSQQELYTSNKTSWHDQYKNSAWIFIGGLPYDLTEGDVICIFSQYGEIVNINMIRDKDTGKAKGFCFLCYEDQKSTVLAVDNFNGIKLLNRILRVDHVSDYKIPKEGKKTDAETKKLYEEGCAPKAETPTIINPLVKVEPQDVRETLADQICADIRLPARLPIYPVKTEPVEENVIDVEIKKQKKDKKKRKKSKRRYSCDESSDEKRKRKKEKKSKRDSSSDESDSQNEKESRKSRKKESSKVARDWNEKEKRDVTDKKYERKEHNKYTNVDYDRKKYGFKNRSRSRSLERDKSSKSKFSVEYKYESRKRSRSRSLDRAKYSRKHRSPDVSRRK